VVGGIIPAKRETTVTPFGDFYRDKIVLVTGHTGFKGSWLATWLSHLGARVIGYALPPPTEPANFVACRLAERIVHVEGDVRDVDRLQATFREHRPDVVFHLAAQPLVRTSYRQPRDTFEINVMGTVNLLDTAVRTASVKAVVAITSDKCYRNVEWVWGYRETDELGGDDPYSGSKASAEIAIGVYRSASFQRVADAGRYLPIASARAGNVIGGGDWAPDRIVPDLIRAIVARRDSVIRNPTATRPWQHVLEPLSGYLSLGAQLIDRPELCAAWNFGPAGGRAYTVEEVVTKMLDRWASPFTKVVIEPDAAIHESTLLQLDCSKARHWLKWSPTWDVDRTLDAVVDWYKAFYSTVDADMYAHSIHQIEQYTDCARRQALGWASLDA
jgi:CDP-glucose 4,6-dehydratase